MSVPPVLRVARLPLALGLALSTATLATVGGAAPAQAAGFGPSVKVSGKDDASGPLVAIAPNGRTAVLYQRVLPGKRYRTEYRAVLGASPARLGAPSTVTAGSRAAALGSAAVFARPDGGFVACFADSSKARLRVEGCSIAPPNGTFGPLKVIYRSAAGESVGASAAMRPDGGIVMLVRRSRSTSDGRVSSSVLSYATLGTDGVVGPLVDIPRTQDETNVDSDASLAITDDGTVAIPAFVPVPGKPSDVRPGLRLMPPGSVGFGPVIPVSDETLDGSIQLTGGSQLVVRYSVATSGGAGEARVVKRMLDGTFTPTLALPGPTPGSSVGIGGGALTLPGGDLLAVTARSRTAPGDSDCYNQIAGGVGSGPLALPGQTAASVRLSDPGQIALYPQGAVLADGTVIAAWENAATFEGDSRLQTAVRPSGAGGFDPSQVLPTLAQLGGETTLASGGNSAALAWTTMPGRLNRPSIVVSAFRSAAPFARQAPLPKHPSAPCDE